MHFKEFLRGVDEIISVKHIGQCDTSWKSTKTGIFLSLQFCLNVCAFIVMVHSKLLQCECLDLR